MRRIGFRILKVEDRDDLPTEIARAKEILAKSNFAAPGTEGERRADTPAQAADREAVARQRALERRQAVLYSLFHSLDVQRDRARQTEISRELDELESELSFLREKLSTSGDRRNASSEQVAKTDRQRGAEVLNTIMHAPSLKKADLPDPFELDNSMGIRSQPVIK